MSMTSVFDRRTRPMPPCGTAGQSAPDPTVYLSPNSESVESPEFEIGSGLAVVRAFDITVGAIRIEMVHGHAEAKRFALAMQNGMPWVLTPTHTLFVIDVPGRYRLVATGIALGQQMPTVVVTDAPVWRAAL
jgi:hypothetical protein